MSEIEKYGDVDSWATMLGPVGDLAAKIAGTELVGKGFRGKPASVAAAIFAGRELGLGPLTSLRGLQVIDGSVSMTAQMMTAKILGAGHSLTWIESTDKAAEVRIVRGDGLGEATARFTVEDARRAGLANKTNWQRWPRAMCRARALSECASMIAADVLLGIEAGDALDAGDRPAPAAVATVQVAAAPVSRSQAPQATEPNDPEPTVEPVAEPEPEPEPLITGPQMRLLRALLRDYQTATGLQLDRAETRDLIGGLAGRELASAKDLTAAEASHVIDRLQQATADAQTAEVVDGELIEEEAQQ